MKHSRLFNSAISVLAGAVILSCSASAALAASGMKTLDEIPALAARLKEYAIQIAG